MENCNSGQYQHGTYQGQQQLDTGQLSRYMLASSPKLKTTNNTIIKQLKKFTSLQQDRFQQINKGCTQLQSYMQSVQEMLDKIQQRVEVLNQQRQKQAISNFKIKQNQFIINQSKDEIRKHKKNQQNMQIQLKHLKKQLDNIKRQSMVSNQRQKSQGNKLKQQINQMQKLIKQKDQLIQVLNEKIVKLVSQRKQENRKSTGNTEKLKQQKQEQQKQLLNKFQESKSKFDLKITLLQEELIQKSNKIQQLQEQLIRKDKQIQHKGEQFSLKLNSYPKEPIYSQGQQSMAAYLNTSVAKASSNYQLQFKLSQQTKLYKQLETEYTSHLTSSNNLQIQLHQQIHQQKLMVQEQKKKSKTQKQKTIQLLQGLTSTINKRSFNYFQSGEVQNIIQEVKKAYFKQKQKSDKQLSQVKNNQQQQRNKITQLQRQIRRLKSQSHLQKQQIQSFKQQIQRLLVQKQREKQKRKIKQHSSTLSNANYNLKSSNSSFGDISNPNQRSQNHSVLQDKYRETIDNLHSQLRQKQRNISQLQKLQSIDFQKSKQKILSIQSQFADTRNQVKKLQRQRSQLNQSIQQLSAQLQTHKNSLSQIKQNSKKQRQQLKQQAQQKQRQLEQKLLKLKEQIQLTDTKCQQKVMKYNKLKSKLQKLQLYNNQTQKRKDQQIQQLVKKNQQLRIDCKLMEEKISTLKSIQGEETENGEDNIKGYNRDLIEQIQIQRDRILEQYEAKRRDYMKQKEKSQILEQQNLNLQQQSLKSKQQQIKSQQNIDILIAQNQKLKSQIQRTTEKNIILEDQIKNLLTQNDQKCQSLRKELCKSKQSKQKVQEQIQKLQQQTINKSKQQYQHIKKQLETQLQARRKLQRQQLPLVQRIKQLREESQRIKKQQQQRQKAMQHKYGQKVKQKVQKYHQQLNRIKTQHQKKLRQSQQKLSEAAIRQENLISIINYKNDYSGDGNARQSMKADEDQHHEQVTNEDQQPEQVRNDLKDQPIELQNLQSNSRIVQKQDKQCNTQSFYKEFNLCRVDPVHIVPSRQADRRLWFDSQSVQNYTIYPHVDQSKLKRTVSVLYNNQSSNTNIFEQQKQLFEFLKQTYPSVLNFLVTSTSQRSVQQLARTEQSTKNQPLQVVQTARIGMNAEESIKQEQSLQNHPKKNLNKQLEKQPLFILQKEFLASCSRSQQQGTNRQCLQYMDLNDNGQRQQQQLLPVDSVGLVLSQRLKFNLDQNRIQQINLFENLKPPLDLDQANIDDNFQICEEGQSINVGQTALNLQVKQIFNKLREQLEKVFNGQQISLSMMKILPRQLQDDYHELISYIRQKIEQIRKQNHLSFIMAEVGDQPEQIQQQLDTDLKAFLDKKVVQDMFTYKKMLQQKQALITSLMNEKTMQQNTINQMTMQKQELDEQHQNRFMNQCVIYKKQIKQLKNKLDALEMNFQSLKNVFRNTMEIWVDDMENQDDLRDNFVMYKRVGKLTELEATRLNYYIFKYRQSKDITD